MANRQEQMKELTDRLEEGVQAVFESGKYEEYLRVMSKFYNYSYRNTLLIAMQRPDATMVAGYDAWQKKFGRQVNKGEKAIKILAPSPYKTKKEVEVIDQVTQTPVRRADGSVMTEEVEVTIPAFRVANVFDVSQTSGRPLPSLFDNIEGDVKGFQNFFKAVESISPVPVGFEPLTDKDGYYHQVEKRVALREGMSERQTAAAAIHEISHATLHALDMNRLQESLKERGKDQRTMEVEAESIAYVVCQHYGIETGENSFGYIAMWSKDRLLPELHASLKIIRDTASKMINGIDEKLAELEKEANQELADELENENNLLTGDTDRYGIYQIADGTQAEDFKFMGMDFVEKQGMKVQREDYRLVYSGALAPEDSLDTIFEKFNLDRPEDFKGHSLSVSDIVLLHTGGKNTAHFVDSFGFREVPEFLNLSEERVYGLDAGEKTAKYLMIQASDEGFDYSFYDGEYKLIDGGVITNEKQPMENVIRDLISDAAVRITDRIPDVESFMEQVGEAEQKNLKQAVQHNKEVGNEKPRSKSVVISDENSDISDRQITKDLPKGPYVEFYVAECDEFHDMGAYYRYPDIKSAAEKYREILDNPMKSYLGNGMGIIYHGVENDIYNNSECGLVSGRVVCGNTLDHLSGLGEKQEMREALQAIHNEFPEFLYKMPRYEKEADTVKLTAEELAVQLDRLVHDFDPYDYQDNLNGQKDYVEDMTYELYTGGVKHYCAVLDDIIGEGGELATSADRLKEKLMAFESTVSAERVPVVRVDLCDSNQFEYKRFMPIDAFDTAVFKLDQVLSNRNEGKDEYDIEICMVQYTIFYPDNGQMQKMKGSVDIGLGNGGLISSLKEQTADRLTDMSWLTYKRGQGQEAFDAYIADLTNVQENVIPYLQSYCSLQERAPERNEAAQNVPVNSNEKTVTVNANAAEITAKTGRKPEDYGAKKSIHERLAINKARLESQPEKNDQVKGVELI